MTIQTVEWDTVVGSHAGEKTFTVRTEKSWREETRISAKILTDDLVYISEIRIPKEFGYEEGKLDIDNESRPFLWVSYSPNVPFQSYREDLLGPVCFGDHIHWTSRREAIYKALINHPSFRRVLSYFKVAVDKTVSKAQQIKDATIKARHGDEEDLLQFSDEELFLFAKIFIEPGKPLAYRRSREGDRFLFPQHTLPQRFLENPGKADTKSLFETLFNRYLEENGYREKIKEYERINEKKYRQFVAYTTRQLADRGFVKADSLF